MEEILRKIYKTNIEVESDSLKRFYSSVKRRAEDIITSSGRQTLILELYDRFFKNAFPLTASKLGIVYTPVEVVDFILNSVDDLSKSEFNQSLGDKNIDILDPFTGTGTFITRLISSTIIEKKDLAYKYKNEIHANEIILLAYYIAGINIESVYQEIVKENTYQAFNGMVLTDTFQLYEQDRDMIANLLPDNSNKRTKQKKRDIRIIIGNPPYSVGQSSANDNAANITYPNLDDKIKKTYIANSKTVLLNSLYDSYIRAFRWASDRLKDDGIIGFVTGAGWLEAISTDGFRKTLSEEFTSIYVINLRGNARTAGKLRKKEGGNVFGGGSRSPIAITILIKNKKNRNETKKKIKYYDIGNYIDGNEKLKILSHFKSVKEIEKQNLFEIIIPDENNDWINKGKKEFKKFIKIGDKKDKHSLTFFKNYSGGIKSNRDSWNYNFSYEKLKRNITFSLNFLNSEVERFKNNPTKEVKNFINYDSKKISWDRNQIKNVKNGVKTKFEENSIQIGLYRPFTKSYVYRHSSFNNEVYQIPKIIPNKKLDNKIIVVKGLGTTHEFSTIMTDLIPDVQLLGNAQCFPMKLYFKQDISEGLFANQKNDDEYISEEAISDNITKSFSDKFSKKISKNDIFYYIYGILHSPDYKSVFKNNLNKELPRIPIIKNYDDFLNFSKSGQKLSEIHIHYEEAKPYDVKVVEENLHLKKSDPKTFYNVKKMKISGTRMNLNKSKIIYNNNITIENIPVEAYEYTLNGKSALNWVIERQSKNINEVTGIENDANDYANLVMKDPKYPLMLIKKIITVSLDTIKIVKSLPKLKF